MRYKSPKRRSKAKLRKDGSDAVRPNQCWSMDFMSDQLFNGRRIRLLTIVDNFSRVSPLIGVGVNYNSDDVVASLETACKRYGRPERIRVDNGPEFISKQLELWAYIHKVVLDYSRPGKPTDNAFIESFNGRFRDECLNLHGFLSLDDARKKIEQWRIDYHTVRPHSSIGNLPPEQFLDKSKAPLVQVEPGGNSDEQNGARSRRPPDSAAGRSCSIQRKFQLQKWSKKRGTLKSPTI